MLKPKLFQAIVLTAIAACSSVLFLLPSSAQASSLTAYNYPLTGIVASETYPTVVVREGDTLSSIASSHGLSWQGLYCTNRKVIGSDPNSLQTGEVLIMKSSSCGSDISSGNSTTEGYASGSPQHIAESLLASSGEASQFSCLNNIIMGESSWSIHAYNPSGAYGIPQALPGSKMAGSWGSDWQNSAYVQLYWLIKVYIPQTYGSPCNAWYFHESHGYY